MNKKVLYSVIIAIAISTICVVLLLNKEIEQKDVLSYSEAVINPLCNDDYLSDLKLSMQGNGLDYTNYWVQAGTAISIITREGITEEVEVIVDNLMNTYRRYGYFPRPPYDKYNYGWVSCMDAPIISVLSRIMYEKTGDSKYKDFTCELSGYMQEDVSRNGYIADIDDEKWLFEYADTNTSGSNGKFVLNGSLLGTLATAIIGYATEDKELIDIVDSQTSLYKKKMSEYWYSDTSWCFYMLNEKRVNPPHYIIFEIRLFIALAEVTGDKFYSDEATRRINLLKRYYKLYVYEENGISYYNFIRNGAPHFYYIDIYNTELVFYDGKGNIIDKQIMEGRKEENSLMHGIYDNATNYVEWHIVPNTSWSVNMGNLYIEHIDNNMEIGTSILCDYRVEQDGMLKDDTLSIFKRDLGNKRCHLIFDFEKPQNTSSDLIYTLELENLSDETFPTNIILFDSNNKSINRYLKPIQRGKNLLIFSICGFAEQGTVDIKEIKSANLRIFTSNMQAPNAKIKIGKLREYNNPVQFWKSYTDSNYKINWGE